MSFEEPTQRLTMQPRDPGLNADAQNAAAQTTVSLPRPLDLAGPTPPPSPEPSDKTEELSLDEIFAAPQPQTVEPQTVEPQTVEPQPVEPQPVEPQAVEPPAEAPRVEEAPTWTAMPVIPVRSEPLPNDRVQSQPAQAPAATPTHAETAQPKPKRTGPSTAERLVTDASAALDGALRRSQDWLTHNDNGLMVMTAAVAIILILVVAAVGS